MAYFGVPGKTAFESLLLVFNGPVMTHLWYLYAIIGLTMFVPFLGMIYRSCGEKEKKVFIGVWLLVSAIIPVAWDIFEIKTNPIQVYNLGSFTGFMGLFFLGAYLHEKRSLKSFVCLAMYAAGFVIFGLIIAGLTFHYSVERKSPIEVFYGYQSIFVVLAAICLFKFAVCLPPLNRLVARVVRYISDCSLGIYCLHPLVLFISMKMFGSYIAVGWVPVAVTTVSVFVVTSVIVRVIRIIPWAKHIA